MSESVILIGGGGHAKVVIDCILSAGDNVIGILDDNLSVGTRVLNIPVLGNTNEYSNFLEYKFLLAIGSNSVRHRIADSINVRWHTAIHPSASVSRFAKIGAGSVVMPHATVNAGAIIGMHCILNTGSIIEHDNTLADFVHVSPGAVLGGTVSVGEETHIGLGVSARNNIRICNHCTIGAGAAVVKDICVPGTYIGIPARRMT